MDTGNSKFLKFISSQIINTSENEAVVVEYDGVNIQVSRVKQEGSFLLVYLNGEIKHEVRTGEKFVLEFDGNESSHNLKTWHIHTKLNPLNRFIKRDGISLIIDDIPVQNTLADPFIRLRQGLTAIWIFFILILIKLLFNLYRNDSSYNSDDVSLIIYYGLPAAILLFCGLVFRRKPLGVLYLSIIIASLETLDFLIGSIIHQSINFQTFFFTLLRLYFISSMFKSIKALREIVKVTYSDILKNTNLDKKLSLSDNISSDESNEPASYDKSLNKLLRIAELKYYFNKVLTGIAVLVFIGIVSGVGYGIYSLISDHINKNKAEELFIEGNILLSEKDKYDYALSKINKAIEYDPTLVKAYQKRVKLLANLNKYEEAIKDIKIVELLGSTSTIDTNYYYLAANSFFNSANDNNYSWYYSNAIEYFKKFINLIAIDTDRGSGYSAAIERLGLSYINDNKPDEAIVYLNSEINKVPNLFIAYYLRGLAKLIKEDYYGAISDSKYCIKIDSTFSEGYLILGQTIAKKIITITDYKVIAITEGYSVPQYSYGYEIGSIYKQRYRYEGKQHDLEDALYNLNKAIKLKSYNTSSCYLWKGIVLFALKRKDEACETLSKAGEMGESWAYSLIKSNCN